VKTENTFEKLDSQAKSQAFAHSQINCLSLVIHRLKGVSDRDVDLRRQLA
jgi:hypothetical protein